MFGDQTALGAKVADIIVITRHPVMKESLYFPAIRFAGRLFLIGKHARQPAPQIVRKLLAVMSGPTEPRWSHAEFGYVGFKLSLDSVYAGPFRGGVGPWP